MADILIVDDDRTYRESMQRVLEKAGYRVQTAEDADTGLRAFQLKHFDLIVCDYRMPGKTGIDLLREIRQLPSDTPVLMISAYADPLVQSLGFELGVFRILKKPVRRQDLIDSTAMAVKS